MARAEALADQALVVLGDLAGDEAATSTRRMAWLCRVVLGMAALARRDLDDARQTLAQQRRLSDNDDQLSMAEMSAHAVERAAGDAGAARAHVEAAVTLARRSQHPLRIAQALDISRRKGHPVRTSACSPGS
jgi:hypothetical protein